jgi:hypothetical protein
LIVIEFEKSFAGASSLSVKEAVLAALKELVLPELQILKQEMGELKAVQALAKKRLGDLNAHLLDQSRRIDAVREELDGRLDAISEKLKKRLAA